MGNFTLFAQFYAGIVTPLLTQMQAVIGNVCGTMQPIAIAMVVIGLFFDGVQMAYGTKTASAVMKDFFIAAMAIGALQAGTYTQYVSDFFLQAVPNTVGAALGGANTSPVAGLDQALGASIRAAAAAYEALPSMSFKIIPLGMGVLVFCGVALLSLGYAFAVYMIAAIVNVAVIVVGPVFLALAATAATRRFFIGWLSVVVGGCVTQIMVLAVITLLLPVENTMINTVVVTTGAANSNTLLMLWGLGQAGLLLALCTAVVKKIPSIATGIAGGVYHGAAGATASTFGLGAVAASASLGASRGASAAIGRAGSAVVSEARSAVRPPAPAPSGPSLSGGAP